MFSRLTGPSFKALGSSAAVSLLAACANREFVHPSAMGLPQSKVAVIVTERQPDAEWNVLFASVHAVNGDEVASFGAATRHVANTVVVISGRYRIKLHCAGNRVFAFPEGGFELKAGYTYLLYCHSEQEGVGIRGKAIPTVILSRQVA